MFINFVRWKRFYFSTKDRVDPPFTPSKVLMAIRVKPFKGNPYWEKETLKKLGFEENVRNLDLTLNRSIVFHDCAAYFVRTLFFQENDPIFVKNTPEMCAMLWRVKHLVKINPVVLPKNLPSKVDDLTEFYVHEDGRVYVTGKIDPARYQATIDARTSIKRLNSETVSEQLRLMWLKGNVI